MPVADVVAVDVGLGSRGGGVGPNDALLDHGCRVAGGEMRGAKVGH